MNEIFFEADIFGPDMESWRLGLAISQYPNTTGDLIDWMDYSEFKLVLSYNMARSGLPDNNYQLNLKQFTPGNGFRILNRMDIPQANLAGWHTYQITRDDMILNIHQDHEFMFNAELVEARTVDDYNAMGMWADGDQLEIDNITVGRPVDPSPPSLGGLETALLVTTGLIVVIAVGYGIRVYQKKSE